MWYWAQQPYLPQALEPVQEAAQAAELSREVLHPPLLSREMPALPVPGAGRMDTAIRTWTMTAYATIIMLIRERILLAIMDRKALTTAFRADITIPDRTGLSDVTASAVRVSYPDAYIAASLMPHILASGSLTIIKKDGKRKCEVRKRPPGL